MKNHIIFKFLAIGLCAACLLGIGASGICFTVLGSYDLLGSRDFQTAQDNDHRMAEYFVAEELVRWWASYELGGFPERYYQGQQQNLLTQCFDGGVQFTIADPDGTVLQSTRTDDEYAAVREYTVVDAIYNRMLAEDAERDYGWQTVFVQAEDGSWHEYEAQSDCYPTAVVTLYFSQEPYTDPEPEWILLRLLYDWQQQALWVLIGCLAGFAVLAVYLCTAAGRRPGSDEVRPNGLNRLPLDLYALGVLGYVGLVVLLADEFARVLITQNLLAAIGVGALAGYLGCLLTVGFCFACAAQLKAPDYYWIRHSLLCRSISLALRCSTAVLRFLGRLLPKCWAAVKKLTAVCLTVAAWLLALGRQISGKVLRQAGIAARWLGRKANRIFSLLPLTWQWLLTGMGMIFLLIICLTGRTRSALFGAGAAIALVLYGAGAFGTLLEAARNMRRGDLGGKIDDRFLVGAFRDFAGELNGLADVAMIAAQRELKSEHMKTELITNVSHDIKTPLTSIINYVDLLAKPHSEEEEKAYLEVLSRQSQRMKKLIEDLIEMSKATTGNIPVEIVQVDAVEAVNQALGEFADKLEAAELTTVFRAPEEPVIMLADGRLVWRAMSNLLSNAVKYALPGTRLYVDISRVEGKVIISMKNISRAELNVSADELMERFVRGDTSRNTEGSGLGLNITRSLMELQKGQLQLLVDGDLFKVTILFPAAQSF